MTKHCKLICMSFDGASVCEANFRTISKAWEHNGDMGSRWIFYPFRFIVSHCGATVLDTDDRLSFLSHRRLSTVRKFFERVSKLPEAQGMNFDEYNSLLYTIWHEEHKETPG